MSRRPIMGVTVDAVELPTAIDRIIGAAQGPEGLGVSALAVHGLVVASRDPKIRHRINELELVVPDGQPVRWALNWLHDAGLSERVFGPDLMWQVCQQAAISALPVFLFGSSEDTLDDLASRLTGAMPGLVIAGKQPSRFRPATENEAQDDIARIRESGARMVFVGLGCPRQEIWTYENRHRLGLPVMAVGAAFDYHAGRLRRSPSWMSRSGLEWLYRLMQEPKRLWRRYLTTNPTFVFGVVRQRLGHQYDTAGEIPASPARPG